MIQRIQSIFLVLVAFIGAILSFVGSSILEVIENFQEEWIVYGVSILLALVSLLSFKKRKNQVQLNYLNVFVNILLIGANVFYLSKISGGSFPEKGIELIAPLVNVILLVFANFYIKKDIKLVKSVDRIR